MTKLLSNIPCSQASLQNNVPIAGLPESIDYDVVTIDRIDEISYESFFTNYLMTNKPCVITPSASKTWKSRHDWVTSNSQPNFDFLKNKFGSSTVPVADCDVREYNSQHKMDMSFKDYIQYWENLTSVHGESSKNLYLKDWHFQREHPEYEAYKTLEYFQSDWLNEFYKKESDDYKFVYMGPKGSWTPLHKDVFGSYSWSANICGRKRWWLFPPGQEKLLRDETNQLIYIIDEDSVSKCNASYLEVIQEAGEVIFVPSGWYHQVWNIENTISINHNWFNGCNVLYIWHCLNKASEEVENEISDFKGSDDWEDHWQIILKAHHGFHHTEFFRIINYIFEERRKVLESLDTDDYSKHWQEMFDIVSIKKTCNEMLNCKLPEQLFKSVEYLFVNVEKCISKMDNK